MKRIIIFITLSFTIFLLAITLIFTIWIDISKKSGNRIQDSKLGWITTKNYTKKTNKKGIGIVNYSTTTKGFREWGDTNSTKRKILIVGDSYTQAIQISDNKTYYSYIDTSLYEVFAYGCGGYGTLQESMIVEKYKEIIKPDLIIFQYCNNDLINNQWELEKQSTTNNYLMKRPYFINNKIEHKHPSGDGFIAFLDDNWTLFRFLHMKYIIASINYYGTIEDWNIKDKYKQSIETTISIINRLKSKTRSPILFFSVSSYGKGYSEIEEICSKSNVIFLNNIHKKVDEAEKKGNKINFAPHDWHWNELGHKIAGEELNKEINLYFSQQYSL